MNENQSDYKAKKYDEMLQAARNEIAEGELQAAERLNMLQHTANYALWMLDKQMNEGSDVSEFVLAAVKNISLQANKWRKEAEDRAMWIASRNQPLDMQEGFEEMPF